MISGYAPSNDINIYYEAFGDPKHTHCYLIPGAMQGTWGWDDHFCETIARQDFFVVRFDHRDIGRSSESKTPYFIGDLCEDIMALMTHLSSEKAHFIGHSMGGHICQLLAINYESYVQSITLIGSGPIGANASTDQALSDEESATLTKTWEVFLSREDGIDLNEKIEGFLKVYTYLNGKYPIDMDMARTYIEKMIDLSAPRMLQAGNPHEQVMVKLYEEMEANREIAKKIKVPTLIIHGTCDPISLPRFASFLGKEIESAKIQMIEDMGHMFLNKEIQNKILTLIIEHLT